MLVLLFVTIINAQYIISKFSDFNLSSNPNCIQCSQLTLDFIAIDKQLDLNYTNLPPHYQLDLYFDMYIFGHWIGDLVKIYANSEQIWSQAFNNSEFKGGEFCRLNTPNHQLTKKLVLYHSFESLKITYKYEENTLYKETPLVVGLRNIELHLYKCHESCVSCSGPTKFDCRTCPKNGIKIRKTNQCRCPLFTYIENGECRQACSRGKQPNEERICQDIKNFLQIYSGLYDEYNVENWKIEGITQYQKKYQDQIYLGMFKGNQKIKLQFLQLPAHSQVMIRFKLFAFYIWASGEQFRVKLDDVYMDPIIRTMNGMGDLSIEECQSDDMAECKSLILEYSLSHTKTFLDIELMSLNYDRSQARFGIREFNLDIIQCSQNCQECSNDYQCGHCIDGFYLHKGQCYNQCPSLTTQNGTNCLGYDELTEYSTYLDYAFINQQSYITNSYNYSKSSAQIYGVYYQGKRWLSGWSYSEYMKKRYDNLPPHYQLRLRSNTLLVKTENSCGTITFLCDQKQKIASATNSETAALVDIKQVDSIYLHNSSQINISIFGFPYASGKYFKYGFTDLEIVLDLCYPTCQLCTGPKIGDCQLWGLEPQFDRIKGQCVQGLYYDRQLDSCQDCQNGCLKCTSANKCSLCDQNYILSGFDCYCTQGYFYDKLTLKCQQCYAGCFQCYGSSSEECYDIKVTSSNCNDGFWTYGEQCDDGNQIDRDGCTNCIVDSGWSCNNSPEHLSVCFKCNSNCLSCLKANSCQECQVGYYLDGEQCKPCQEGCSNCLSYFYCLTCQVSSILPLDGKCQDCPPGLYIINDLCQAKCGDGLIAGDEECDDGNLINYDGCSDKCKIEKGFICQGQVCEKNVTVPAVDLAYQNRSTTNTLMLSMNNTVSDCNEYYLQVWLQGFLTTDFNVYFHKINATNETFLCQISFKFFRNVDEHDLIHIYIYKKPRNIQRILAEESNVEENDEYTEITIQARKEVYYSDQDQENAQLVLDAQNQFTLGLLVLGPTTILLGGFSFFFSILDILAWLNTFYYFNVYYPPNVNIIFENSAWDELNFLEMPVSFNQPTDDYYIESPLRFDEKGTDPLFINNTLMCFMIWGMCIVLFFVCRFIIRMSDSFYKVTTRSPQTKITQVRQAPIFQLDQSQQLNQSQQLDQSIQQIAGLGPQQKKYKPFPWIVQKVYDQAKEYQLSFKAIVIKQLNLTYLDLCTASVLQMLYWNHMGYFTIFWNLMLSILGFVFCLIIIIVAFSVSRKSSLLLGNKNYERSYGSLYEGINVESDVAKLYCSLSFIRKILFTTFMVTLYDYPIFQTSMCCAATFLNTLQLIYSNPFESRIDLYQLGVPDACIFFIMCVCVAFAYDDKVQKLTSDQRTQLGWVMIAFIIISVGTQLIFIFRQFYLDIKEKYEYMKQYLCS